MKKEIQHWHKDCLSKHSENLFKELIHPRHITNSNQKIITFKSLDDKQADGSPVKYRLHGYFARKNKQLYWFDEGHLKARGLSSEDLESEESLIDALLPIKPGDEFERLETDDNKVLRPLAPVPLKITPEKGYDVREMIDNFIPFEHTNSDAWLLMRIIGIALFSGRGNVCISTNPNFGKSSVFNVIHSLTDKCPVFKPRTIPGILNKITSEGNMVFDEAQETKKETRDIMQEFVLLVGGGAGLYINGALSTHTTKEQYNTRLQSITFLYNRLSDYQKQKHFFETMFTNNAAVHSRFLKLKFEGDMDITQFHDSFDVKEVAAQNKLNYIKYTKWLYGLQEIIEANEYKRRYVTPDEYSRDELIGRQPITFNLITYLIDMYSESQEEYESLYELLKKAHRDYIEMCMPMVSSGEITHIEAIEKLSVSPDDTLDDLETDMFESGERQTGLINRKN